MEKYNKKSDILNVNIGTNLTLYLQFWTTSNIVFTYLWVVTIEMKSNKVSDQLIESPSNFITAQLTHLPYLCAYF